MSAREPIVGHSDTEHVPAAVDDHTLPLPKDMLNVGLSLPIHGVNSVGTSTSPLLDAAPAPANRALPPVYGTSLAGV